MENTQKKKSILAGEGELIRLGSTYKAIVDSVRVRSEAGKVDFAADDHF